MQRTFLRVLQRTRSCRKMSPNMSQTLGCSLYGDVVSPKFCPSAELNTWSATLVWRKTLLQSLPAVQIQMKREMAGHNKFSNIKHRKEAQDNKKAALMNQFVRLAKTAVKGQSSLIINLEVRIIRFYVVVRFLSLTVGNETTGGRKI